MGIKDYVEIRYTKSLGPKYTVILENQEQVRDIKPDFMQFRKICKKLGYKGVLVTSKGKDPYDYVFRNFAPCAGINEDHGAGVAHCALAPYWSDKLGRKKMRSLKLTDRLSEMKIETLDDAVLITGTVTPLIKGTLTI